jgi:lysophospholipase L1-like esterase
MRAARAVRAALTGLLTALLIGAVIGEAALRRGDPAGRWRTLDAARDPAELTFTNAKTIRLPDGGRADAPKPAGTFRVVCVGGSFAAGYPAPGRGFPERLAQRLKSAYPGRRIKVWNLGRPGYGSRRDAVMLDRVVRDAAPDLLVVEEGNNEAFEAQLEDALARRPFARAVSFARAFAARSALGTRLLRAFPRRAPAPGELERSLALSPSAGPLAVTGADAAPAPERLAARLRTALARIAAAARARGVAVLVVVPPNDERRFLPTRVDWPSIGTPPAARAPAAALLRAARALDAGRSAGCEETLAAALDAPVRLYLLGRCEDARGRAAAAAEAYASWHDRQNTATRPLKNALRAEAAALGLPTADLDADLRREKISIEPLFSDDHHMTAAGYAWAGDRIARAAAAAGLLSALGRARPGALDAALPVLAASPADRAKTDVLLAHQFGAWSVSTDEAVGRPADFARRSAALYAEALELDPRSFGVAARPDAAPTARGLLGLAAWRLGRRADAARLFAAAAAEGAAPALWRALDEESILDPSLPLAAALSPAGGTRPLYDAFPLDDGNWQLGDRGGFFLSRRSAPSRVVLRQPPELRPSGTALVRAFWNGRPLGRFFLATGRRVVDVPGEPGVLSLISSVSRVPLIDGTGVDPLPSSVTVELGAR